MFSAVELCIMALQIIYVEIVFVAVILGFGFIFKGSIQPMDALDVIVISIICSVIAVVFLFIGALIL